MGARQKLNAASITGNVLLASLIGAVSGSWVVFVAAALILLGVALISGDIRPGKKGQ